MPEPIKRGRRYMPGLDGLRAIAVLGVIAYHLELGWAPGGLLGVSVFFTLSGYLITDLLLAQVAGGGIRLKEFWLARARRLLPALFVMLIVVMAWVAVIGPDQPPDFRAAAASATAYINNWWLILHDVSYFAQFEAPGALNHLWSLSIEEQFYIVWPFILMLGIRYVRESRRSPRLRPRLGGLTLALALSSGLLMLALYEPGIDPSRVYYGTDTRALELLVGAALATVWPSRLLQANITAGARRTIDAWGVLGLIVIALMFASSGPFSPFLYRGGFLLLAVSTVLVVAALAHPASRLGPIVGCRPMRWIGERSYGIYLWHFPIIILVTPEAVGGPSFPLSVVLVAATFGVAALSWKYVEDPIRHGALSRLWGQYKQGQWRRHTLTPLHRTVLAGCALVVVAALAGFAGLGIDPEPETAVGEVSVAATLTADPNAETKANRVSCDGVVHIGDSTSEGLVSSDLLPDPKQLIASRYARVGAATQHLEVSGARSIYETFEGIPNAVDVALGWKNQGFGGCWVFALGTNETANVAAGSNVGLDERIDKMMSAVGDDRVLWVNVRSLVPSGPYAASNMELWNDALLNACDRYPGMRIYDWATDVKDEWFIADGIHFTTPGYAARSKRIAGALLEAFPASGPDTEPTARTACSIGGRSAPDRRPPRSRGPGPEAG